MAARLGDQPGGIRGREVKRQDHGAMGRGEEKIGGDGIGGESGMHEEDEMEGNCREEIRLERHGESGGSGEKGMGGERRRSTERMGSEREEDGGWIADRFLLQHKKLAVFVFWGMIHFKQSEGKSVFIENLFGSTAFNIFFPSFSSSIWTSNQNSQFFLGYINCFLLGPLVKKHVFGVKLLFINY